MVRSPILAIEFLNVWIVFHFSIGCVPLPAAIGTIFRLIRYCYYPYCSFVGIFDVLEEFRTGFCDHTFCHSRCPFYKFWDFFNVYCYVFQAGY